MNQASRLRAGECAVCWIGYLFGSWGWGWGWDWGGKGTDTFVTNSGVKCDIFDPRAFELVIVFNQDATILRHVGAILF